MSGLARTTSSHKVVQPVQEASPRDTRTSVREIEGIVHILTCGSVDDGKSTLIGRLLWESTDQPDDQREMVRAAARKAGSPDQLDYSLLLDGLLAEREQGITIDVAWRYLDTDRRRFVIIDSPGHEQYTRNMASGASHADVAVMLIDARHGVKRQTRRHAAVLDLMGVRHVVLAVNKMDLAGWSEQRFRQIEREFRGAVAGFGFDEAFAIPVSARNGDNVAQRSTAMPWYDGPTLVAHLEQVPSRVTRASGAFRMPVQTVLRDGQDFRALAGTVGSGTIRIGDIVCDTISGRRARVERIATMDGDLPEASAGRAIALQLDADIDVARGAVLSAVDALAVRAKTLDARLVWLADRPLDTDHGLLLRSATDLAPVASIEIKCRLDLATLRQTQDTLCCANDIVIATIALGRTVALDRFAEHHETGSFVLVDPLTGGTLGAGVILDARPEDHLSVDTGFSLVSQMPQRFTLTHEILARGLCSDLGTSAEDTREFGRRTREVERLLRAAGVPIDLDRHAEAARAAQPP